MHPSNPHSTPPAGDLHDPPNPQHQRHYHQLKQTIPLPLHHSTTSTDDPIITPHIAPPQQQHLTCPYTQTTIFSSTSATVTTSHNKHDNLHPKCRRYHQRLPNTYNKNYRQTQLRRFKTPQRLTKSQCRFNPNHLGRRHPWLSWPHPFTSRLCHHRCRFCRKMAPSRRPY